MLLNFIGRGSAFNAKEGNNSAYIKKDGVLVLLDCGESVFEKLINKKILENVKEVNVFITHLHSDHVGSLSSLLYYCYFIKKIDANVYFPTKQIIDLLKFYDNTEGVDYKFHLLKDEEVVKTKIAKLTPFKVSHSEGLNSYGYLINYDEKHIWYSGDCNKISNVINDYELDEIYHDACLADYEGNVHTCFRVLCEHFKGEIRNKIYFMHLDCDELISKAKDAGFKVVKIK